MSQVIAIRILVVDDEETFLRSTSELLRRDGHECDLACNGSDALALLKQNLYDLIVADIKMPGNVDLEFVRQVAARSDPPPVILVTGYPSIGSAIESIELPVIAYLVKPFELSELLAKVRVAAGRSGALRAMRGELARLHDHRQSLLHIESQMAGQPAGPHSPSMKAFAAATMRNLVDSLANLRDMTKAAEESASLPGGDPLAAGIPDQIRRVLHDVVSTLERTKSAFKSKELGELRRKLEKLLNE
jgi:DNA-binding NtrC family response regulator